MTYELYYSQRGYEGVATFETPAKDLDEAVNNFLTVCSDMDNTGIFFDIADADPEYVSNCPRVRKVNTPYGEIGIELEDLAIYDMEYNTDLLELRAKRELLGVSIEKMAELTGQSDYDSRENGKYGKCEISPDELSRYMAILDELDDRNVEE